VCVLFVVLFECVGEVIVGCGVEFVFILYADVCMSVCLDVSVHVWVMCWV